MCCITNYQTPNIIIRFEHVSKIFRNYEKQSTKTIGCHMRLLKTNYNQGVFILIFITVPLAIYKTNYLSCVFHKTPSNPLLCYKVSYSRRLANRHFHCDNISAIALACSVNTFGRGARLQIRT